MAQARIWLYGALTSVGTRIREVRSASSSSGLVNSAQCSSTRAAVACVTGLTDAPRSVRKTRREAAVARVRAALDVTHALELLDRLRHCLFAHPGEFRQFRDGDALGRHEWEHIRVRGAEVAEARLAERDLDVLGVVLVEQSQQERDQRSGGEMRFHGIDRRLSTLLQ